MLPQIKWIQSLLITLSSICKLEKSQVLGFTSFYHFKWIIILFPHRMKTSPNPWTSWIQCCNVNCLLSTWHVKVSRPLPLEWWWHHQMELMTRPHWRCLALFKRGIESASAKTDDSRKYHSFPLILRKDYVYIVMFVL